MIACSKEPQTPAAVYSRDEHTRIMCRIRRRRAGINGPFVSSCAPLSLRLYVLFPHTHTHRLIHGPLCRQQWKHSRCHFLKKGLEYNKRRSSNVTETHLSPLRILIPLHSGSFFMFCSTSGASRRKNRDSAHKTDRDRFKAASCSTPCDLQ